MAKFEVGDLVKVKKSYRSIGEKHAIIELISPGSAVVRYTDGDPEGTTDLRGPIALKKVKDKPASDTPTDAYTAWEKGSPHWYGAKCTDVIFAEPYALGTGEGAPELVKPFVGQEIRCQAALEMLPDGTVIQDDAGQVYLVEIEDEEPQAVAFSGDPSSLHCVNLPATIIAIDAY